MTAAATPPAPTFERGACRADAARLFAKPRGGGARALPAPNPGYNWLGGQTNNYGSVGIYGALNVVDPASPHTSTDFLAHRIMVKSCDSSRWLEIGWAEVGWRANAQYIYSFNTVTNTWMFFDQYPIASGSRIWVALVHVGNNVWEAQLFWNGAWQTLVSVNPGSGIGCGNEQYVEPYKPTTNFNFPTITTGDGTSGGMKIARPSDAAWLTWNTSIPTLENNASSDGYYNTTWNTKYYAWQVRSNQPPVASLYVSPTTGQASTTSFYADLWGSYDPEGSGLSYRISWGDGSTTYAASGTHTYSSAGTKTITGTVTDNWGQSRSTTRTVRVCTLLVASTCV
ncbi:MAG TPA: PKD domain-containing protein [Acidimicrobiales bacterium]